MEAQQGIVNRTRGFVSDVVKELKKTTWPTQREVQGTTLVVIIGTIMVALYLGVIDHVFAYIQQFVLLGSR